MGLSEQLEKGHFPHHFNTPDHRDYTGSLPPIEDFVDSFLSTRDIVAVCKWHREEKEKNEVWSLKNEMIRYCVQDVRVLKAAWLKFSSLMFEITGLRPGEGTCTLAGFTNLVWQSTIPSKQIGVVPAFGYRFRDQQSQKALLYLWHQDMFIYGGSLQFAGKNEGEKRIVVNGRSLKVDGFHETTKTVVEFLGCLHGCPKCYAPHTKSMWGGKSMQDSLSEVQSRLSNFRKNGYNVNAIWECEFDRMCQEDETFQRQLDTVKAAQETLREPAMEPKVVGGRCEAFALWHEMVFDRSCLRTRIAKEKPLEELIRCHAYGFIEEEEQEREEEIPFQMPAIEQRIRFVDFTSLYPFVMKNREYPIGHPQVFTSSSLTQPLTAYKGLVRARVLPPRDLYIPLLSCKISTGSYDKMMYVLCRTCAEERNFVLQSCNHDEYIFRLKMKKRNDR